MPQESIMEKRLHHLNLDIAKAKTIMQGIQSAFPNTTTAQWNNYQKLTRIYANAENIVNTFRKIQRLNLCRQALRDLDIIRNFLQDYSEHYLKRWRDSFLDPPYDTSRQIEGTQSTTLRNYRAIKSSEENDPKSQPEREAQNDTRSSKAFRQVEIIDLTVDSEEDVGSMIGSPEFEQDLKLEPNPNKAYWPVPLRSLCETKDWLEYELRRESILWYEPEEHLDTDMLP